MNEIQSIDRLTSEILILKQQTAQNIIEIGKRLMEVKESLPHGEWGKYLEEKVDFSNVTATRFMRVANEFSNVSTLKDLTQSKIFALLDLPQEEREEFIQNNNVDEMTTRELQKAIKEKQGLEKKLKKIESEKDKLKDKLSSIEEENKEALTNKEMEIENLKTFISETQRKLEEAQSSGDNEEVEKLQSSLQESENKLHEAAERIEDLEKKLKEKPIEVIASPQVIEKVPESIEKELQELRGKLKENSSQNAINDKSIIKFSVQFDELVKTFKDILETLENIPDEEREKYKKAIKGLIGKMEERL